MQPVAPLDNRRPVTHPDKLRIGAEHNQQRQYTLPMAEVNESEVVFELPAENPLRKASLLSILFFRYRYLHFNYHSQI